MLYLKNNETNEFVPVKPTIFPDKTSQVWKLDEKLLNYSHYTIKWVFESESEIMHLCQLVELICDSHITLEIPYLPYARQDKEISNNSTFALRTFSLMLNSLFIDSIKCYDVHSEKAIEYIHALSNKMPEFTNEDVVYILPDKGAKRYLNCLPFDASYIVCEKVRDQQTGYITHYEVPNKETLVGKDVLVIDDLIDGGLTFGILAESLEDAKLKSLNLYVSHAIFSKGLLYFDKLYDTIWTVNLLSKDPEVVSFVKVIQDVKEIVLQ